MSTTGEKKELDEARARFDKSDYAKRHAEQDAAVELRTKAAIDKLNKEKTDRWRRGRGIRLQSIRRVGTAINWTTEGKVPVDGKPVGVWAGLDVNDQMTWKAWPADWGAPGGFVSTSNITFSDILTQERQLAWLKRRKYEMTQLEDMEGADDPKRSISTLEAKLIARYQECRVAAVNFAIHRGVMVPDPGMEYPQEWRDQVAKEVEAGDRQFEALRQNAQFPLRREFIAIGAGYLLKSWATLQPWLKKSTDFDSWLLHFHDLVEGVKELTPDCIERAEQVALLSQEELREEASGLTIGKAAITSRASLAELEGCSLIARTPLLFLMQGKKTSLPMEGK